MMKGKKAQGELIPDTFALIFIVFLLIIFFMFSSLFWSFSGKKIEIGAKRHCSVSSGESSFYAFLQKPVEVEINGEKQTITNADLIRLSEIDPNYKSVLDSQLNGLDSCYRYIFRTETDPKTIDIDIKEFEAFRSPHFYIPAKNTILATLQIEEMKK